MGDFVLTIYDLHVVTDKTKLTPEQHEFELDYLADRTLAGDIKNAFKIAEKYPISYGADSTLLY